MGLPALLMNPRGEKKKVKKDPRRVAAGKKAARTRKAKKAARSAAAKKASKKRTHKKAKSGGHGGSILLKSGRAVRKLPPKTRILFSKKPKIRKVSKRGTMKMTAFQKENLKGGAVVDLQKSKRTVSGYSYSNPKKRKHKMNPVRKHRMHRKHRRNPQFNLKKIASFAGGAAAALVVHKYGIALVGNFLSKLPVIGQYAEKINTNKWANIISKGAVAGLVYKLGSKKSEVVKNASKAYAGTALALVIMQAVGVDQKLMLGQEGMGEMEGIEMNGIEMNGIEMNGIESLGETDGIEMGAVYGDGLNGNEGVY